IGRIEPQPQTEADKPQDREDHSHAVPAAHGLSSAQGYHASSNRTHIMKHRYFATECSAEYVALHILRERRGRGVTRANNCESPWREAANGGQLQGALWSQQVGPPDPAPTHARIP